MAYQGPTVLPFLSCSLAVVYGMDHRRWEPLPDLAPDAGIEIGNMRMVKAEGISMVSKGRDVRLMVRRSAAGRILGSSSRECACLCSAGHADDRTVETSVK
ncbi:hypothetical protein LX32DRAFT_686154 [Colletotrichum zoysiae]|uniref:Uncharacterized protein n=1 Tax=Colletotrichum zoysiae TaxID=1216348 RepID=A0AAD9LVR0_9PEZI|nr:hypothetical protein LX32DRAFT_686154 [Colletotrichum zoysiae]